MTHCFHAYTCRIYRHVFRTCIRISEKLDSLSDPSASYSLSVRQVSALLSASFRPLVTKTPLPSRYFLPHVGLNRWTFTTSSAPCRAHQRKAGLNFSPVSILDRSRGCRSNHQHPLFLSSRAHLKSSHQSDRHLICLFNSRNTPRVWV